MHSVSYIGALLSIVCHVYYRQMRSCAWNGTHLTNIDHDRARDSDSCRENTSFDCI